MAQRRVLNPALRHNFKSDGFQTHRTKSKLPYTKPALIKLYI